MIWLIIFLLLFALILLILSIPLDIILKFGSLNFSAAGSLTIKLLNIMIRQFSFSYNIGGSGKFRCNFKLPIRKRKTDSPFIEIDFEGLLKKTKVKWSVKLSVGTEDAAMLSLIIGFLRTDSVHQHITRLRQKRAQDRYFLHTQSSSWTYYH